MESRKRNIAYWLLGFFLLVFSFDLIAVPAEHAVSQTEDFVWVPATGGDAPHTLLRLTGDAEESEVRINSPGLSPYIGEFHSNISRITLHVIRRMHACDIPRPRIHVLISIFRI